jgi:CelD/BcsL family acetyltransferase involved in cellulose biosynthesis
MHLTWTRELPEQKKLREQWNALVLQMEKPEVFYTWEWAAAVTRAFQGSVEPWIATAYEGDELIGVAALAKPSATEAVFLAGNTADYCDFISLPGRRKEFVGEVLQALRQSGTQTVVLANLPAESATVAALESNQSFKSFLRTGYVCGQVRLGSEEERRALTDSLLKKKMLRRSLNALQRMGPVTLQHDAGAGLANGALDKFCATHVARFLATGRISNLVREERREFLRELARLLAEQGWFDLMSLHAGDPVLAWNYGFRFQGSWFWYQPTIVNTFEALSPGYCLLTKIVEDACRDPETHLVDLGLGAEGYKERFANAQRTTLYATLSRSGANLWKVRARYHVAEAVKKRPGLESLARRVQKVGRSCQKRVGESGWADTLAWAGGRLRKSIVSTDEVFFFRWSPEKDDLGPGPGLVWLSWEILAAAAMRYAEDCETLDYLLRSAARFRSGKDRGCALLGADGSAQHFAWVAPYEGFAMAELNEVLRAPSPASVMIFDCWTPRELRGRGLYGRTIGQLAALLSAEGKEVWIFSAAANPASRAGIEKAGFQMQLSHSKRKVLWWAKTRRESRGTQWPKRFLASL